MFQQKYIEEYQNITAPTELKDRVWFSAEKARRTTRHRWMLTAATAAGIALFCLSGSLLGNSSTILSVNDVVVTQEALPIRNQKAFPVAANMGHQRSLPVYIPMVIEVEADTQVTVSLGALIQEIDANQYSEETTDVDISETTSLYWIIGEEAREQLPICTVITDGKEYQYVVEYQADIDAYSIRKQS